MTVVVRLTLSLSLPLRYVRPCLGSLQAAKRLGLPVRSHLDPRIVLRNSTSKSERRRRENGGAVGANFRSVQRTGITASVR